MAPLDSKAMPEGSKLGTMPPAGHTEPPPPTRSETVLRTPAPPAQPGGLREFEPVAFIAFLAGAVLLVAFLKFWAQDRKRKETLRISAARIRENVTACDPMAPSPRLWQASYWPTLSLKERCYPAISCSNSPVRKLSTRSIHWVGMVPQYRNHVCPLPPPVLCRHLGRHPHSLNRSSHPEVMQSRWPPCPLTRSPLPQANA